MGRVQYRFEWIVFSICLNGSCSVYVLMGRVQYMFEWVVFSIGFFYKKKMECVTTTPASFKVHGRVQ